jgi:geranylgeranyl diphosphate synthase, type I
VNVPEVLRTAGTTIAPAFASALDQLSAENRRVVDYHMGWRDSAGQPVQRRGSKSVRPGLVLLAAKAAGGSAEAAIPGALAVEFLHNWAFLIDDVMDGDRYRRHRETAWVVFGQGAAICAGTALLLLAQQTLLDAHSPHGPVAVEMIVSTGSTMLAGQAEDLAFEGRDDITVPQCLRMTELKTASLMRCALAIGSVLCGADPEVTKQLGSFGHSVGVAFQARDDLLGIWGRPEQTGGRPPAFDLRARKRTLPVVAALAEDQDPESELRSLLAHPEPTVADLARLACLIDAAGGRAWTAGLARDMVAQAHQAIEGLRLDEEVQAGFAQISGLGLPDDV